MNWLINGGVMDGKPSLLGGGSGGGDGKVVGDWWPKIASNSHMIHHYYYHYIGSMKLRKSWWKKLLVAWVVFWIIFCFGVLWFMSSYAVEKRKESLTSMCDKRARMLQDQFNVSLNHIQAMSILISTFHHGKYPSAIDQRTFARYTERIAFERPLTSGVAYAVKVLHSEREQFEKQHGWTIKRMDTVEQEPVHKEVLHACSVVSRCSPGLLHRSFSEMFD
ncbi:histidine kinase 3-like isoform X2 [Chenopodium quinoa]|nr:histidine kinase 3-like isoform X2 [Chenopodium quinoa]